MTSTGLAKLRASDEIRSFVSMALLNFKDLRVRDIRFAGLCTVVSKLQEIYTLCLEAEGMPLTCPQFSEALQSGGTNALSLHWQLVEIALSKLFPFAGMTMATFQKRCLAATVTVNRQRLANKKGELAGMYPLIFKSFQYMTDFACIRDMLSEVESSVDALDKAEHEVKEAMMRYPFPGTTEFAFQGEMAPPLVHLRRVLVHVMSMQRMDIAAAVTLKPANEGSDATGLQVAGTEGAGGAISSGAGAATAPAVRQGVRRPSAKAASMAAQAANSNEFTLVMPPLSGGGHTVIPVASRGRVRGTGNGAGAPKRSAVASLKPNGTQTKRVGGSGRGMVGWKLSPNGQVGPRGSAQMDSMARLSVTGGAKDMRGTGGAPLFMHPGQLAGAYASFPAQVKGNVGGGNYAYHGVHRHPMMYDPMTGAPLWNSQQGAMVHAGTSAYPTQHVNLFDDEPLVPISGGMEDTGMNMPQLDARTLFELTLPSALDDSFASIAELLEDAGGQVDPLSTRATLPMTVSAPPVMQPHHALWNSVLVSSPSLVPIAPRDGENSSGNDGSSQYGVASPLPMPLEPPTLLLEPAAANMNAVKVDDYRFSITGQ